MLTKIIIRHDDVAALKSHPLWPILMELTFAGGAIEVQEISQVVEGDEQSLDRLELALHQILGHGNITGHRAREIAGEALGEAVPS